MNPKTQLIDWIFSKEGALCRTLKNFEERTGQKEMAKSVLESYEQSKIALLEAGTGIGKSMAYLVPAIFWALKHKEKTVIATHTIALQEQLIHKDIPFLLEIMGEELKCTLVKGMGNYLCLRKLSELQEQPLLISTGESQELDSIEQWAEKTEEGSRSDLSFAVTPATWEKVAAESESCNHAHCPHYKNCFFFKARKEAEEAQLLVVNHHLLLADVESRRDNDKEQAVLPNYQRLVIDEAHHLEEIALESFAARVDRIGLIRQLAKVHSEQHSRLALLRKELSVLPQIPPPLIQKLEIDLPAQKRRCHEALEETFALFTHFFEAATEQKKRLHPADTATPFWQEEILPSIAKLQEALTHLALALVGLLSDLETYKESPFYEKLTIPLLEIQAVATRLEETSLFLKRFASDEPKEKRVRWWEKRGANASIVDASLDVSTYLQEHLFSKCNTSILCSATLTTARSFLFLKQRLGFLSREENLKEEIYESPFNYRERTLLAIPTDLPEPSHPDFLQACFSVLEKTLQITRGGAFLLFTSYDMLQKAYAQLEPLSKQFPLLKQGELPRHLLLEKFKTEKNSVLFGTDSFWEGVDVPGNALRCVVITKLPFSVPTDPLHEAYAQSLQEQGLNPFFDYSVPQAVIKFKQGFGRLMRSKEDRGCVLCLDTRLVKKNYGKKFLDSLPTCRTCFAPQSQVFEEMRTFYGA